MQVFEIDNVKIYNLSAGKSLPDWLTEQKKRALLKKNVDLRRRIELIQEFDMPGVSTSLRVSKDGQYIMATGIYKPRVKCFDVNNLSLKFERCLDSEVVTFEVLSDDYTKLVKCRGAYNSGVCRVRYVGVQKPMPDNNQKVDIDLIRHVSAPTSEYHVRHNRPHMKWDFYENDNLNGL